VKLSSPAPAVKRVAIQTIKHLPEDPAWRKVENAFGCAAYRRLRPPDEE